MEENENNVVENPVENTTETASTETQNKAKNVLNTVVETLKAKKNLVIGILIAIIVICLINNIFFNTKGKAKNVVKSYYAAMNKGNFKKAYKYIDMAGSATFSQLDEDDYEDFWKEYKEFKKSDEWEEQKDEIKDYMDEAIEDAEESYKDAKKDGSKASVKVKKITDVEKIGSHLYKVEGKLAVKDEDGEKQKDRKFTHYVMKKGLKCYIINGMY